MNQFGWGPFLGLNARGPLKWSFFFSFFFLACFIAVVSIGSICFIRVLALRPPVLQFELPALLLVCVLFVLFLLFVIVLSGEPRQKQGRGLVDRKLVQAPPPPPPVIFIAGRPKAALLVWFFGDFRCGALLFMVIHVIYKC